MRACTEYVHAIRKPGYNIAAARVKAQLATNT